MPELAYTLTFYRRDGRDPVVRMVDTRKHVDRQLREYAMHSLFFERVVLVDNSLRKTIYDGPLSLASHHAK